MTSNDCNSVCKLAEDWCNTDIQIHEVKYVWTIKKFDFHEARGSQLVSPTFSARSHPQVNWYLTVEPNGDDDADEDAEEDAEDDAEGHISLLLHASTDSANDVAYEKIFAKFSVSVLDRKQKEIFYIGSSIIDETDKVYEFSSVDESPWGLRYFLEKDDFFRSNLLTKNQLTIICRIIYSPILDSLTNTVHHCNTTSLYSNIPACNLGENLGMLLKNQDLSDIVLCVKKEKYPAHKVILAARSSVFAAMFKHNLKENETNRIIINDMSEEVVAEMLRYIYTGKCENSERLAVELLAAADKYDLDRLKIICAEAVFKTLSVENAANILVLADLHSIQELKSKAIEFIVARFAEVVDSTAWQNILSSHSQLANEVCKAVAGLSTKSNKRKKQDISSECKRNRID